MRIPRVFENQSLSPGQEIELGDFASQHLGRALRLKPGSPVVLFNGEGGEYKAELTEVGKKRVRARIVEQVDTDVESSLRIHLGQSVSRGERMDYAVQKATELGVTEVTPLFSERCEVRLNKERQLKRVQHWQQVAVSASEQSLRCQVPGIHTPEQLGSWLEEVEADLKLVLDPRAAQRLESFDAPQSVALLIGPEGGLADNEVESAKKAGFKPIALGPRVLRTETAPVAAIALLQYLWGDYS